MKKLSMVLAAALLGAGTLHAGEYLYDERVTDTGKAQGAPQYYPEQAPGRHGRVRADYKESVPAYPEREHVYIGKFFSDGWTTVNGRVVFLREEILPIAPESASFSAAALNARRVRLADE